MYKILFSAIIILSLLSACVRYSDGEPVNQDKAVEPEEVVEEEEAVEEIDVELDPEPVEEEEKSDELIKVNDELLFANFTVNMEQVNVYEEDGKAFADVSFKWLNQAGDGKKMFMSVSLLTVYQGDVDLEETTGAWDIENRNTSSVYFPNAENGEMGMTLTYELVNKEEPLTIMFTPLNHLIEEDGQEVTLDIE